MPAAVLMENAGRGAALVLDRIWPRGRVLVAVGSGNNGGDGVVLARTLFAQERHVEILLVGDRPDPDPLLHGWPVPVRRVPEDPALLYGLVTEADVLVDALLGTGVSGAPRPPYDRVIRGINRVDRPRMALDVPTGVDSGSGAVPGEAVQAELTVAFGDPKLGTMLFPGRAHSGRLVAVEIGFPPSSSAASRSERGAEELGGSPPGKVRLITGGWARANRPVRPLVTHKKAAGHLLVVAGSGGMAGAAILAALGGLRGGAGYVQIVSPAENRVVLQSAVPEALFVDASDGGAIEEAVSACDAIVVGPGVGLSDESVTRLRDLGALFGELDPPPALVLDADALTLLGEGRLGAFRQVASPGRILLTPHPGEMVRLGASAREIEEDPIAVGRRGAEEWNATLLLKGTPSIVAGPGGSVVWVSGNGSSDLARAGMGDTLAGVAGAFLARGCDAMTAAALALHYTGLAALLSGRGESLLPSDVSDLLGRALRDPETERSELNLPFVTLDLAPAR